MQICVKIIPLSGIHNGGTIENGNPEKQNFEEWLCCSAVMNLLEIEMIHHYFVALF
jgi:hypothetical protein